MSAHSQTVLVTAFDPFGGEPKNSGLEAVLCLSPHVGRNRVIPLQIPVVYHEALKQIEAAILLHNPDVILSVGQAGGSDKISIERQGKNLNTCSQPDNVGQLLCHEVTCAEGPECYRVNVPVDGMMEAIRALGIPAQDSEDAGGYVCNHVVYGVQHLIATKYPGKQSGFIHVPFLPEQVLNKPDKPSMKLELIVQALTAAIEVL
eukprot:Blabericola_migrator_1__9802@NODE_5388_length_785_cov_14_508357_g3466_i0_p1_GENE_NODE_5388_length_785_cov_14_508357_g3466_i0NODE_5388_length_785_cov_14_508357_g3466_i0_p1_ORF_typecomplete_len204_score30_61Peptidase_C15/PF01470_17/2_6e45_NODE_5388_length_785_cov_14_508357_g3466_i0145756